MALLPRSIHVRASMAAEKYVPWPTGSFAQAGEDILARNALRDLGIMRPYYLDLGAHHATWLSNTYFFYRRGGRGVRVEADPELNRRIARRRRRDVCLNVALGTEDGTATLHVMEANTLSTISPASLGEYEEMGRRERQAITVPMLSPQTLLREHCRAKPNLVSLDIEGIDLDVLQVWDFDAVRPEVFIIETLTFSDDRRAAVKRTEILDLMTSRGYMAYADTFINTVFVDERAWQA